MCQPEHTWHVHLMFSAQAILEGVYCLEQLLLSLCAFVAVALAVAALLRVLAPLEQALTASSSSFQTWRQGGS